MFNIIGSIGAGYLANQMPKRYILAAHLFPARGRDRRLHLRAGHRRHLDYVRRGDGPAVAVHVPPTNALVALMFGTRWLTMLAGFAFFSHQVGGFLGVWLGGVVFERTGSYDAIWWLFILLGILSARDQSADQGDAGGAAGRGGGLVS